MPLPDTSTIRDVRQTLTKAEDYVCGVMRNFAKARKVSDGVVVRIGLTGDGKAPHYRFDDVIAGFSLSDEPAMPRYGYSEDFNGRSHGPLITAADAGDILQERNWSKASMNFEEVQTLLGEIRQLKGRL